MRRTTVKRTVRRRKGRRRAYSPRRPHPGGAPRGNLNALRHGAHAHPLDKASLAHLAAAVQETPGELATLLFPAICSIQRRAPDTFRALIALRALIAALTDIIADSLFHQELSQALSLLPPLLHDHFAARVERLAADKSPVERLSLLRKVCRRRKQLVTPKQP